MSNKIVKLASELIKVPSTKENPKALQEVLAVCDKELGALHSNKFTKNNVPSMLYYNTSKTPKRFKVILNAHLDVVPAKENQYKPIFEGDKLYGRGAIDMKAAAAVEILVFKELAKKVKYPLGLQLVTDEEIGGANCTKYQIEKGVRADFVIAGEQTELDVSNKAKGIVWAKITCKGKSAHGAHVWEGKNAITKMTEFSNTKLYKTFPMINKAAWVTTANLAKIESSNTAFNKVPDDCSVSVDFRYIPEEKDKILQKIEKMLPKGFSCEIVTNEPSQFTQPDNVYALKLLSEIGKNTGKKAKYISDHGASDIRHYDRVNVQGVCFGPIGKGLHTDNEWVSIKSLEQYYEILKNFLLSLN
jgi:succinyl-diaminopimelate desuccinylase